MDEAEALIRTFAPLAQGMADGVLTAGVIAAPIFLLILWGMWRTGLTIGGGQSRKAAIWAAEQEKSRRHPTG